MGKSNCSKKISRANLQRFLRINKIWKILMIVTGILFVASLIFIQADIRKYGWIAVVALIVYIICCFMLRQSAACPYCGKFVMSFIKTPEVCPHCRRPLKEKKPDTGSIRLKH